MVQPLNELACIEVRGYLDAIPAGSSQDNQHLAAPDETIEVAQNLDLLLSGSRGHTEEGTNLQNRVEHILLVVGRTTKAVNTDALEGNACLPSRVQLGVPRGEGEQVLHPMPRLEVGPMGVQSRVFIDAQEGVQSIVGGGEAGGLASQLLGETGDLLNDLFLRRVIAILAFLLQGGFGCTQGAHMALLAPFFHVGLGERLGGAGGGGTIIAPFGISLGLSAGPGLGMTAEMVTAVVVVIVIVALTATTDRAGRIKIRIYSAEKRHGEKIRRRLVPRLG